MQKIHCPHTDLHTDSTPSCVIYPTGTYFCFGCRSYGKAEGLGIGLQLNTQKTPIDLKRERERIDALPKRCIRGFNLPADASGFYICFPNSSYYIKRLYTATDKYISPYGCPRELYIASSSSLTDYLFIVEGQLNAKSLAMVSHHNIVSFGGTGSAMQYSFVNYYLRYNKIAVIMDNDSAGVEAGNKLKACLSRKGAKVVLHLVDQDYNEIYVNEGPKKLKEEEKKVLEMLGMR